MDGEIVVLGCLITALLLWLCRKRCPSNEEAVPDANAHTNTQQRYENVYPMPSRTSPQTLRLEDTSQLDSDELPTWVRALRMHPPLSSRTIPLEPLNYSELDSDELPTWVRALRMHPPLSSRTIPLATLNYSEINELPGSSSSTPQYHRTRSHSLEDLPPSYAAIRAATLNYPEMNDLPGSSFSRPQYHRTTSYSVEDLPPSYVEATGQTQQAMKRPHRYIAASNGRGNT